MGELGKLDNAMYQMKMKIEKLNDKEDEVEEGTLEASFQEGKYEGLMEGYQIVKEWRNKEKK